MEALKKHATVGAGGRVVITGLPYDKGERVEVVFRREKSGRRPGGMTARQLLESPLVGKWAGRKDLGDSLEFSRHLREQAQSRQDPR